MVGLNEVGNLFLGFNFILNGDAGKMGSLEEKAHLRTSFGCLSGWLLCL